MAEILHRLDEDRELGHSRRGGNTTGKPGNIQQDVGYIKNLEAAFFWLNFDNKENFREDGSSMDWTWDGEICRKTCTKKMVDHPLTDTLFLHIGHQSTNLYNQQGAIPFGHVHCE